MYNNNDTHRMAEMYSQLNKFDECPKVYKKSKVTIGKISLSC